MTPDFITKLPKSRGPHQNRSLATELREKVTAVMGKDGKDVEFLRNLVANPIMSYPYHSSVVLYDYIYINMYMYTLCICIHYVVFVRVFHYMMYRINSELFFMGCRLGIFLDMYVLSISLTETPEDLS